MGKREIQTFVLVIGLAVFAGLFAMPLIDAFYSTQTTEVKLNDTNTVNISDTVALSATNYSGSNVTVAIDGRTDTTTTLEENVSKTLSVNGENLTLEATNVSDTENTATVVATYQPTLDTTETEDAIFGMLPNVITAFVIIIMVVALWLAVKNL